MTTPISDDQLQAIRHIQAARLTCRDGPITSPAYINARSDVDVLLQALTERNASITQHIAAFDRERAACEQWMRKAAELEVELVKAHEMIRARPDQEAIDVASARAAMAERELAELRKPVAVERNEAVENLRSMRMDRGSPFLTVAANYDAFDTLLSAYDTLAQQAAANDVRWRRASDVWRAEMDGLKGRLEKQREASQQIMADDQRTIADLNQQVSVEVKATNAAEERERRLREALSWVLESGAVKAIHHIDGQRHARLVNSGDYDSVTPPAHLEQILSAALAQSQQQEKDPCNTCWPAGATTQQTRCSDCPLAQKESDNG